MAEELQVTPSDNFSLDVEWPVDPGKGDMPHLDASIARIRMLVKEVAVTAYLNDAGSKNDYLTIPTYHLVEWLAQNWWSFLYEPRKLDQADAMSDFRSRHWLGAARNGVALPDALFSPSGATIEISARTTYLRFAQLSFTEAIQATVATEKVRSELATFITSVLAKLSAVGVHATDAHKAWAEVTGTSKEDEEYCRLIGAMGLCPYVEHPTLDEALNKVSGAVSQSILSDLCEAATIGSFNRAAEFTGKISESLEKAPSFQPEKFLATPRPADNQAQAYDWGYEAAAVARAALKIADDNPTGRTEFFKKLGFDPKSAADIGTPVSNSFPIQGAVSRSAESVKVALSQGTDKEFSAARASFLAWSNDLNPSRLVTTARTRSQRASRAFAAELLMPAEYLKKQLGKSREVSPFVLDRISADNGVASTVVRLQAQNNGYEILEAA